MTMLHLRTLGGFEVSIGGLPAGRPTTQKARALLAYLALNRGRAFSRETLVETFWPDADPEKARQSLKTALWSIRRVLRTGGLDADAYLQSDNASVTWTGAIDVDAAVLAGDPAEALEALRQEHIPRGGFLEGDYDEWAVVERERIERRREELLTILVQQGDVRAAEDLLARDPYNSTAYRALIDHAVETGRTSTAAALADKFAAAMHELGERVPDDIVRLREAAAAPPATFELAFVGRDAPLAMLRQHIARARGDIAIVSGTAGMGKTQLLGQLDRRMQEARVVYFGVLQNQPPFSGWNAFYETLTGAPFSELRDRYEQRLPNALAQSIAAALPERAVLVVDDAHRLSGDALQIAAALAQTFSQEKKAVVFASRSEGLPALRSALAGLPYFEITLDPLAAADVHDAVTTAAGRELPQCAEALAALSGGYPLFMRAIVDEWIASGVLRYDGGWQFESARAASVPQSVRAIVESRLLEKGEGAAAFACAFALAPHASAAQLAQAAGISEQQALDALDDLFDAGVLMEDDRGNVRFTHDIVQETAARLLRAPRRKAIHRALAEIFERAQHAPAQIAHHYREAGEISGGAQWSIRAATDAIRSYAFASAADQADGGLNLLERAPRPELRAQLLMWKGLALLNGGDAGARGLLREAADAARDCGDDATCLQALMRLSRSASQTMSPHEPSVIGEAERLALKLGDKRAYAAVQYGRFLTPFYSGDYEAAIAAVRREYDAAREAGDDDLVWEALSHEQKTHSNYGRLAEAVDLIGKLEAIAATPLQRADLHYSAGHTCVFLFRHEDVARHAEQGIEALATAKRDSLNFQPRRPILDFGLQSLRAVAATSLGGLDSAVSIAEGQLRHPLALGTEIYGSLAAIEFAAALAARATPDDLRRAVELLADLKADSDAANRIEFVLLSTEALVRAKLGDASLNAEFDSLLDRFEAGLVRLPQIVLNTQLLIDAARIAAADGPAARAQRMFDEHIAYFRNGAGAHWSGPEPATRV